MRPGAAALLQHQWIAETRRTLKKSWTGGSAFLTRGRGGASGGAPPEATEAHESVYSVVNRMLAAEDSDPTAALLQSQQQQQQRAGVAGPGGTPSPSLPGLPAAAAASMAAAVSPLRDGRVLLATAGSVPLPPLPPTGPRDAASPMTNNVPPSAGGGLPASAGGTPTHHQSVGAITLSAPSRPQQLGGMIASLQGGSAGNNQQGPAWLDASEVGVHMARRGTAESVAAAAAGISFSVPAEEDRFGDAGPSREIKIKVRAAGGAPSAVWGVPDFVSTLCPRLACTFSSPSSPAPPPAPLPPFPFFP